MERKGRKVNLLSPNEEVQIVREELQRRRKLRLQQVREQERYIAQQVRHEVQKRKDRELQNLAATLEDEWQTQKGQRIQTLEQLYKENLQDVGQAHRNANQHEPDWEALAMKRIENEEQAVVRHQKALQELTVERQADKEQRIRPIEARKKALKVERKRAAKIASLPQPPPDPIESIGIQTPPVTKSTSVQHFSVTHHHHTLETAVDRETDVEQPDAEHAAALEARRVEEMEKKEVRGRQKQLDKARLRGDHALRKEKAVQEGARLVTELGRLQQADLQRRRHLVNCMSAQIFQPLFKHDDLRNEQQRELEIAFQDLFTEEKELRGDLALELESEPLPLPVLSVNGHSTPETDPDLDVSFDPNVVPCEEAEPYAASSIQPIGSSLPVGGTGRLALRRLLERIRTQRDQWSRQNTPEVQEKDARVSLPDWEWQQESSLEEAEPLMPETSSKASEDAVVIESKLQPEEQLEEQFAETDSREMEEDLNGQLQEQLSHSLELKDKQHGVGLQLEEAQLHRESLHDMFQVQSGMFCEQETLNQPQDIILDPLAEVNLSAPLSGSVHTQRLHEYQQRLLKQNRLHRQYVQDAFWRLEEYKKTLKLRYAAVSITPPPQSPSLNEEVENCTVPCFTDGAHATAITVNSNTNPGVLITHATPALDNKQKPLNFSDSTLVIPPLLHSPVSGPALTTYPEHSHIHIAESTCSHMPVSLSHSQHDGILQLVPRVGSLGEERPANSTSELEEVLPPPSLVLELLLSGRSTTSTQPDPVFQPCSQIPLMSRRLAMPGQIANYPGFISQNDVRKIVPPWDSEVERNHQVREQMKKQKDLLQALLKAEHQKSESISLETEASKFAPMDAPLKASEKSNRLLPDTASTSQSHAHNRPSLPNELCETSSGSRVRPPISCPPRALQILLQDLEQHKLSTIQEVDSLADVTLDTAIEACMESSSCSERLSSSVTPSFASSSNSQGLSAASEITTSQNSTAHGSASRLSWRETLQLESLASHSDNQLNSSPVTEKQVKEHALPQDGTSAEPDYLTSTTLSTGSYSTSEHDPSCTITDSSLCSNNSVRKSGAVLTSSSNLSEMTSSSASTQCSSSLQQIIKKYTEEMNQSLRSVLSDTFQPLSPEMTNNETAECSMTFQLPVSEGPCSPHLEDSTTNTHTTSSDWLDCGPPSLGFSTDHKSANQSEQTEMVTPLWKWILRTESALSLHERNSGVNQSETSDSTEASKGSPP